MYKSIRSPAISYTEKHNLQQQQQSNSSFSPQRKVTFSPPSSSPSRRGGGTYNNYYDTTNISSSSSSPGRHHQHRINDPNMFTSPSRLETEIRHLEEELVRWQLRGEWASRTMIALESQKNRDNGTLFRLENRVNSETGSSLPSTRMLQDDVSRRISEAEANGRRIQDAISETLSLKGTQERTHNERVATLRKKREQVRDKKLVLESQLRVSEGALQDDDMLSDAQYKRYATRLEKDREETLKRHDSGLKQLGERNEQRCNNVGKETAEMVRSYEALIHDKKFELQQIEEGEQRSLDSAASLGGQIEEVERADIEIVELQKQLALMQIQEREAFSEKGVFTEEIKKAHNYIYELDAKLSTAKNSNNPLSLESRERTQQAVIEGLHMTVRKLQQRVADEARARRLLPSSSSSSINNNINDDDNYNYRSSTNNNNNNEHFLVKHKVDELEKLQHATKLDVLTQQDELARLSDHYLYLDGKLREALLEGELLNATLMKDRVDHLEEKGDRIDRPGTAVGAATIFAQKDHLAPRHF